MAFLKSTVSLWIGSTRCLVLMVRQCPFMLQPLALKRTHKQVFGAGACSLIVRCKENHFSLEFSLGILRICVMYEGGWGVGWQWRT